MIVAEPGATPVASPVADTVAADGFDDVHPIVRPVNTFPAASFRVTTICAVSPMSSDVRGVVSATVATGAGGGATIVTVAAPVCPSLVPMIDAVPAAIAVTRPVGETVATSGLALDQATLRPVRTFPETSRSVTVAWVVWPRVRVADPNDTATDATGAGGGALIVTEAVAVTASAPAVMVAAPALTPVSSPVDEMLATAGFDDDHTTARFGMVAPLASRTVAERREVSPAVNVRLVGVIVTAAAGTVVTDTVAVALRPSAVARTPAVPTLTPETSPVALTVATASLSLDHVTGRFGITFPLASRTAAVS